MSTSLFPVGLDVSDDSDFVCQALRSCCELFGFPPETQFHELSTSEQSSVLLKAQALKTQRRP